MVCRHDATTTCDECGWVMTLPEKAPHKTDDWREYLKRMGVADAPDDFRTWLFWATSGGRHRHAHFASPEAVMIMLDAFNAGKGN